MLLSETLLFYKQICMIMNNNNNEKKVKQRTFSQNKKQFLGNEQKFLSYNFLFGKSTPTINCSLALMLRDKYPAFSICEI